jgi:YggT family protein
MLIISSLLKLLIAILDIYSFFLTAWIILSLLVHFDIINYHNSFVRSIKHFLDSIINPALNQIRSFLPLFGAIDLSPLALYLAIGFFKNMAIYGAVRSVF